MAHKANLDDDEVIPNNPGSTPVEFTNEHLLICDIIKEQFGPVVEVVLFFPSPLPLSTLSINIVVAI